MSDEVTTYENHAQDSRVRETDVMPTMGHSEANSPGSTGNNPLVLATFGKVGHAVNADGDGEKYAPVEVAQTLNTFQNQCEGRAVELCVGVFNQQGSKGTGHASTEDTSPTLGHCNTSVDVHAVCIDGNKLCKNERAGGSGLGVSEDEVSYTETANDIHAVAVRTANTHANGHGVADEATHTLDRASGQAVAIGLDRRNQAGADEVQPALQSSVSDGGSTVCVGFSHVASGVMLDCQPSPTSIPLKRSSGGEGAVIHSTGFMIGPSAKTGGIGARQEESPTLDTKGMKGVAIGFKAGQSADGGLGEEAEVCPTQSSQPSALEPTVAIGYDGYNQLATKESCMTLRAAMSGSEGNDATPKVAIGIDGYNQSATGEVAKTLNSIKSDADHTPMVATMLKVRCGKDTYTKPDGSVGTAGKGPLASEESAFTLAATQDQSLVLRHIVRRLTPIECERLMALPDNYTRIPYRGKPADQCPDSPRYKALGNSWATNCAEWILRRIVAAVRLGIIPEEETP